MLKIIKIENIEVFNFKGAIRGMRNPMNSWEKSDSYTTKDHRFILGKNDKELALKLIKSGSDHRKFLRQIFICMDITAPLCFWKDMDTYCVAVTKNSCSTMHKLGSRELTYKDFSWDYFSDWRVSYLEHINKLISEWQKNKTEDNFREMIHDLLDSFNQKRTWTGNYEVLRKIYFARKTHKQKEFRELCRILEDLPYSEFIWRSQ